MEVSPRFNDCDLCPKLELCGVLSGVDSSLPGAHYRCGEKLKGILFRSKKVFFTAYGSFLDKWIRNVTHARTSFPVLGAQ
jgi:hypothetical protein